MFDGKDVLVTGGTGSFGRHFIQSILDETMVRRVVVFSRDELKQHDMRMGGFTDSRIQYMIGDMRDLPRLQEAFQGVNIVVHAAALKQVPACEGNPTEAVATNITGAQNLIRAALQTGVERVLAMSTDKASNPVNLYGATKLVMEKLVIQANGVKAPHGCKFACVRYGNVVGSRGSVVHVFRNQIAAGAIRVTDSRMTRFWITLNQGVAFVRSCIETMQGGEIFVPKLPSTNIMDVATAVAPDTPTKITGIRPGEKLHEAMVGADEARLTLDIGDRYCIQPAHDWWQNPHGGTPVPDGFCYDSETNQESLTVEELRDMIRENVPS